MEDIKRIECFVPRRKAEGQFNSYGELTVYNRQAGKDHAATLFISKDEKPPKVFTPGDVVVGHERFAGVWHAYFKIGNQMFHISPIRGEEGEKAARWQAEMLRSAFGIPRIGDVPEHRPSVHLPDPLKP